MVFMSTQSNKRKTMFFFYYYKFKTVLRYFNYFVVIEMEYFILLNLYFYFNTFYNFFLNNTKNICLFLFQTFICIYIYLLIVRFINF